MVEDGTFHFGEEWQFPCRFEVAHMQDGNSWVIVYIDPNDKITFLESQRLIDNIDTYELSVIGNDVLVDALINVSIKHCVYMAQGDMFDILKNGLRLDCKVWQYSAIRTEDNIKVVDFTLANLPLRNQFSNPNVFDNARQEFNEATHQAKIDAVIEEIIDKKGEGISENELRQHLYNIADQAQIDFRAKNNSPVYPKYIPIVVNGSEIAQLFYVIDYGERSYDNQPLSRLKIKKNMLHDDWTFEDTANWICALFSLSLGRDIKWNYYHAPINQEGEPSHIYFALHRVWRSKTINQGAFQAFTEKYGHFDIKSGLDDSSLSLKLIDDVFQHLFTIDLNRGLYLYVINSYINYISYKITDAKHRSALLCLFGEQIYKIWIEVISTPSPPSKKYSLPNGKISKSILYNNLMWLFETNGWTVDGYPDELYYLPSRIWKFVQSRNSIFHDHEFDTDYDSEENDKEISHEYHNIVAFIPLLFATILQYKGEYWHPLAWKNGRRSKQWERMPS